MHYQGDHRRNRQSKTYASSFSKTFKYAEQVSKELNELKNHTCKNETALVPAYSLINVNIKNNSEIISI